MTIGLFADTLAVFMRFRARALEGYSTDTAGTGREALKKSKQHRYALALLNYRLPDMTNKQLQARMQARTPKLKIAVLGVIPIDPEKLIEIVEEELFTIG
jgi:CheY-like chemotaxis protein